MRIPSTEESSLNCSLMSEDRRRYRMVCTSKISLQKLQNSYTGSEEPVAVLPPPPPSGYHLGTSLPSKDFPYCPLERHFKI